jgi:hypothetical protein
MISDPPSAFIVAMDQQEKFGKWARKPRVKPEKTLKVFECRKKLAAVSNNYLFIAFIP